MNIMERERTHFIQLTPRIRDRLERTVENLLALLDALDGDPDLETTIPEFDPDWPSRLPDRAHALQFFDDDENGADDERAAQPVTLNCEALPR